MAVNYANYEFSFGTMCGDILFKRYPNGDMDVYNYQNGEICPGLIAHFEKDEWAEFCVAFGNRFVKSYNPNSMAELQDEP